MKKELKDLEDVHLKHIAGIIGNTESTLVIERNELWGLISVNADCWRVGISTTSCDIVLYTSYDKSEESEEHILTSDLIECIDYLRQFYTIPNPYAPIVGVGKSAEDVLQDIFPNTNLVVSLFTKNEMIQAMQSYASQPIGKGAEEDEEDVPECMGCGYPLSCANPHCEYDKGAVQYHPPTPTTDWEKVAEDTIDIFMEELDGPDWEFNEKKAKQNLITYLKQHIGGGDRDKLKAEVLRIVKIGGNYEDIADAIVDSLSLTAPASEQVDIEQDFNTFYEE